jgi:hypothetical protein
MKRCFVLLKRHLVIASVVISSGFCFLSIIITHEVQTISWLLRVLYGRNWSEKCTPMKEINFTDTLFAIFGTSLALIFIYLK